MPDDRPYIEIEFTGTTLTQNRSNSLIGTNIVIDYGDRTTINYTGDYSHTYSTSGTYTIRIYGVTSLGEYCFYHCSDLTSVVIPNSVTSLGKYCFADCYRLTNIQFNWTSSADIPIYHSNWIINTDSNPVFSIPQGTTSLYEAKGYPVARLIEESPEESLPYQPLDIKGQGIISLKIKGREVENITRVSDGTTLYQKHKPESKNIKTSVIFSDNDNADLNRPNSVTINLFQNGALYDSAVVDATTEWTHVFNDLPISENDKEIEYSINIEPIMWYVVQIIDFTITLIYQPEEENLIINKVWHDSNNSLGIRPAELLVQLQRNGTSIESVQLSESNNWAEGISVPTYYNNEVAEYSWVEEEIEGYLLESSLKDGNRTILINAPIRPDVPTPGPK